MKQKPKYQNYKPIIETSIGNSVTFNDACKITGKTARTMYRWIREGWPPPFFHLVSLYAEGRIKPDSWKHCFFNLNDELEIYSVGQVSETDILNIPYLRELNHSHQHALKQRVKELEFSQNAAETEIDRLNDLLDEKLNSESANDRTHAKHSEM